MDLSTKTFSDIVLGLATELSNYFVTLFAALSVLLFIWGVTKYIYKAESQTEREKGKNLMLWGLIGLFVLFGIWGIIKVLTNTFGFDFNVPPQFENDNSINVETPPMDRLRDSKPFGF